MPIATKTKNQKTPTFRLITYMQLLQHCTNVSHVSDERLPAETLVEPQTLRLLPNPAVPKKRILLADDDGGVRLMLSRVLKSEGYEVAYATTSREAAVKFIADPPHLVLLDLNMPGKDGWEAFGLMSEKHPLVPVIVITARPHQHAQAIELGIDALMEKPLNLPLLLETIKILLNETEAECAQRLTNPEFKTVFLNPHGNDTSAGAGL